MMHASVRIVENGSGCQTYFPAEFAADSRFPLDSGSDALAFVTPEGGLHLVPADAVSTQDDLTDRYPVAICPPREALPPAFDVAYDIDDGVDDHTSDTTTDNPITNIYEHD